jgi:hypothetical protein
MTADRERRQVRIGHAAHLDLHGTVLPRRCSGGYHDIDLTSADELRRQTVGTDYTASTRGSCRTKPCATEPGKDGPRERSISQQP